AAGHRILVALRARLRVVHRSEAVRDHVAFLEGLHRRIEIRLGNEPVGQVIETGRRFGGSHLSFDHHGKRAEIRDRANGQRNDQWPWAMSHGSAPSDASTRPSAENNRGDTNPKASANFLLT